uniref:Uncharacterized protein n=1 Tax=Romanomermis culicivorax TaxID=13658 RepID=A0A915I8A0_ROMCU
MKSFKSSIANNFVDGVEVDDFICYDEQFAYFHFKISSCQKSEPKKSPKQLNHAFGQLLTAPEVMGLLKALKEAKKTKEASSANKFRVCFIA